MVSVIAALSGTIILALPIAVVGVTFDDEWVKQAKINKFAAESCVRARTGGALAAGRWCACGRLSL